MESTNEIKGDAHVMHTREGMEMDHSRHAAMMGAHAHQQQSVFVSAGHFILHFLEMCAAMCIGGVPLIYLFFWGAGKIGYPDLVQRFPELSYLVIALILSLVMTAWMRFRGMAWRPTLEMASTTIILWIVLAVLGWLGILTKSSELEWLKSLACPVMLIPMFLRLDHYTGRMSHSMHAAHH